MDWIYLPLLLLYSAYKKEKKDFHPGLSLSTGSCCRASSGLALARETPTFSNYRWVSNETRTRWRTTACYGSAAAVHSLHSVWSGSRIVPGTA